jgi:SAM-dependent methyltransferase
VTAGDRAGRDFWEETWASSEALPVIDPSDRRAGTFVQRRLARYLDDAISARQDLRGSDVVRLVEIGCGRSAWLPYLARRHGLLVSGLDYSSEGCRLSRLMMEKAGVAGEITCADVFDPPAEFVGAFDIVLSLGVAEHFEDTAAFAQAAGRLAAPGGLVVTVVPNLMGLHGALFRGFNPALTTKHVVLSPGQLSSAHRAADLTVEDCGYVVNLPYPRLVNLSGLDPRGASTRAKSAALLGLSALARAAWWLAPALEWIPPSRAMSPFGFCRASKPTLGPDGAGPGTAADSAALDAQDDLEPGEDA